MQHVLKMYYTLFLPAIYNMNSMAGFLRGFMYVNVGLQKTPEFYCRIKNSNPDPCCHITIFYMTGRFKKQMF